MSSSSTNNNESVIIDNKELQQAANNNNTDAAAASTGPSTTTNTVVVDNKSASQVAITSMFSPSPIPSTEASVAYACANLKAAALGAGSQTTRPIHITIAQDVSGSMSGQRLAEAQASLRFVVEQLREIDSIGIVTFSNNVGTALPLTQMSAAGKQAALRAINSLRATGSTNLSGGLFGAHNALTGGRFFENNGGLDLGNSYTIEPQRRVSSHANILPSSLGASSMNIHATPFINGPVPVPVPPTAPPTLPADTTIPVTVSFSLDSNGNKPEEKYRYKLSIIPPASDDKISKFTIHDPESRFADIMGSGETEYDLKPVATPIQRLEITFDLVNNNSKSHKVDFFMGEVASAKRVVKVPTGGVDSPKRESPIIRPRDNNNQVDDGIVRCVFLFTDGHANVGIRDAPTLVQETKKCLAAAPRDATIFTFGFGANHNAQMLQSVADAAEGLFYFIENTDMMPETFADCLGGICSTVATNVKVTAKLTPGCGVRFSQAMTKFKTEIQDDGNTLIVKLKDLYSEEKRDILLELKVDGPTAKAALVDNANAVVGVSWTLEYSDATSKNNNSGSAAVISLQNTTRFVISSDTAPVVNAEVDEMVQRFKSIEVMEKVREAADAGHLDQARLFAQGYTAELRAAPSASRASNIQLQQQMCNLEEMANNQEVWRSRGGKVASNYAQSHAMQRGNAITDDCAYAGNAVKMEMRKKASKKS